MKILITGSGGFIGEATTRAAAVAGHTIVHFDRSQGDDVTDPLAVSDAVDTVDHVIHLAGVLGTSELFDAPYQAIDVNVVGTLHVLEACKKFGAGFTGITMPPVFESIYTATKVCADRLATAYRNAYGLRVSHVCAYNAFGPGQKYGPGHPQKIIPTFATKAWAGEPLPIWGDGTQGVDLVHADDIGRMLVDATRFGDDQVFDAGTGTRLTVNEVAEFVLNHVRAMGGPDGSVEYLPMRPGEKPTAIVADGAGWELLGWHPELDAGSLEETIEWYHPDAVAARAAERA